MASRLTASLRGLAAVGLAGLTAGFPARAASRKYLDAQTFRAWQALATETGEETR